MKQFLLSILIAAGPLGAESAQGAFESLQPQFRPKLSWEALKGYRLFFHPDSKVPLRRALILAIPTERHVRAAWSLVRPILPKGSKDEDLPWLRVEGKVEHDHIAFEWNGRYRDQDFPDQTYHYDVHVRWMDGDKLDQQVVIHKSQDHPQLVKVGEVKLGEHKLAFKQGNYEAEEISASLSLADQQVLTLTARVFAPPMEDMFYAEGIQVSFKYIESEDGFPPQMKQEWECACQAALPPDSPAREKARKVLCPWDLAGMEPGVYELRLSLYHKMKHPAQFDPCDTPILDEDRVKILLRP